VNLAPKRFEIVLDPFEIPVRGVLPDAPSALAEARRCQTLSRRADHFCFVLQRACIRAAGGCFELLQALWRELKE